MRVCRCVKKRGGFTKCRRGTKKVCYNVRRRRGRK